MVIAAQNWAAARHPRRASGRPDSSGRGSRGSSTVCCNTWPASVALAAIRFRRTILFVNQFFNLLLGARQENDALFEFVTRLCWQTDQSVMAHRFHLAETADVTERLSRVRAQYAAHLGEVRDFLRLRSKF